MLEVAQELAQVLIDGRWQAAHAESTFHAENPATGEALATEFPVSGWEDCDAALTAAASAAPAMRAMAPERLAAFLEAYAANIEAADEGIVAAAHEETGAAGFSAAQGCGSCRRTTNQLRQAATAAREESWKRATLDVERNIRSYYAAIGPVKVGVFGPNNFPLRLTA